MTYLAFHHNRNTFEPLLFKSNSIDSKIITALHSASSKTQSSLCVEYIITLSTNYHIFFRDGLSTRCSESEIEILRLDPDSSCVCVDKVKQLRFAFFPKLNFADH